MQSVIESEKRTCAKMTGRRCSWLRLVPLFLLCHFCVTDAFIIPDEVPSILSIIYSNIPIFKKGTDSRLGWGFRLGNRADFQVLVELGPQKNTVPLGNQPDNADSGTSKRNSEQTLRDILYAQRVAEKKHRKNAQNAEKNEAGRWLEEWSSKRQEPRPEVELGVGEVDAKSVIPPDSVAHLEQLYRTNATDGSTVNNSSATTESNAVDGSTTGV